MKLKPRHNRLLEMAAAIKVADTVVLAASAGASPSQAVELKKFAPDKKSKVCRNCNQIVPINDLSNHLRHECVNRWKKCYECGEKIPHADFAKHKEGPDHTPVDCKNCKTKYLPCKKEHHEKNTCGSLQVACPACEMMVRRDDAKKHTDQDCKERKIVCKKCAGPYQLKDERSHDCITHLSKLIADLAAENKELRDKFRRFARAFSSDD